MQYKLSHLPLIKIILPFMGGIFLSDIIPVAFDGLLYAAILLFFIFVLSHALVKDHRTRSLQAVVICLLIVLAGGLLAQQRHLKNQPLHFSKQDGVFAKGIIVKPLEEKEKTYKSVVAIRALTDSSNHSKPAAGNLLVYLQKDSTVKQLEMGDEMLFRVKAKTLEKPKNPGQFDYKNYLEHKSIYHQQYITAPEIALLQKHKELRVRRFSHGIGLYVQNILRKYVPGKENFALADGILLGHRADIDMELYNAFAYTGILHILSVSGLHVGIIYGMLLFLLSFIKDRNRPVKIAKFIFITLFIWLFTFVTGFSAACVRAAILFTLLNYGRLNKEHVSNLNILAGSALLQLLIDPDNLFDIGFQLSYLAMLGLFIFTKPIYALYYHPNKLIDWTWQLWSASIAAQLFTVPLSIYYFGNFPTYFLLANIFAIPLSAVILWLGVALIPLSFIPAAAGIAGWLNSLVITLFIKLTYLFSELPLGKIRNLYLSKTQLLILLTAVLLLALFVLLRKAKYLLAGLSLFLVSIFISYAYSIEHMQKDELIVYSVPKNLAIGINTNDRQLLLLRDSLPEKTSSFLLQNSCRLYKIREQQPAVIGQPPINGPYYADSNFLYARGKSFYFLTKANSRKRYTPPLQVDYLILCDNAYLNMESVKTNYNYTQLLLSSDNDPYHISIYRKLLDENKMNYVDLSEQSLVMEL